MPFMTLCKLVAFSTPCVYGRSFLSLVKSLWKLYDGPRLPPKEGYTTSTQKNWREATIPVEGEYVIKISMTETQRPA